MSLDLGNIGALSVLIGGDTTGLLKALKEADGAVDKHSKSMRGLIDGAAKYALALSATGAAVVSALVVRSFLAIDAQAKLARQLRVTSDGLETLHRAAGLAGIEHEQMTAATRKLDVAIGQAAMRNAQYADTFERLHINIDQLSKMDADQRILAVNDAIRKFIPENERAAIAAELFSRKQGAMIASLGADDIATAKEEVRALGLAVSEVDSTTIERANDQLSTLEEVARGAANRLAVALAPAVDDISKRIRKAAIDSQGFKVEIETALKRAIDGVGFLLDAFRGLEVVLKIGEIGFQTLVHAAVAGFGLIVKGYMELSNLILGTSIKFEDTFLGILLDQSDARFKQSKQELADLAGAPMPSTGLKKWFDEVKKTADAVSEEVVRTRKAAQGGGQGAAPMTDEEKKRIASIRESLSTQEEVEAMHHEKMLEDLQKLHKQKLISETDYNDLIERETKRNQKALADIYNDKNAPNIAAKEARLKDFNDLKTSLTDAAVLEQTRYEEQLAALATAHTDEMTTDAEHKLFMEEAERQHWANLAGIRQTSLSDLSNFTKWSFTDQTNHVLGELANLTSGAAQQNRAMFEANKAFGISSAIVSAYVGISKTLETYPFPVSIAMAAGQAVAAFAQVNAIRSASFGKGGGAPSIAGSTPAPATTNVQSGAPGGAGGVGQTTIVNLTGDFFSRKQVRNLLESVNEGGRDGGRMLVAG